MKTVDINGISFPIETQEEAEFLLEELGDKDIVDTLIGLGDWLRACGLPDPTDDEDTVGEVSDGE